MGTTPTSGPAEPPPSFGLGISVSPSWTSDDAIDQLMEVAKTASHRSASVFLVGDKPGGSDVRSNAELLAWRLRDLAHVPQIGSLFLVRRTPVD
jgi:hypothetical protein